MYVVMHHSVSGSIMLFGLNIASLFRFGEEAVILFFLLSGFVINYSFVKSRDKTFKTYLFKRVTRIYIPLLIVMALGYFMECYGAGEVVDAHPRELLLNLMMMQDISQLKPNVIVDPYMHNSPLWSLSYEWWFYMIYFPVQKHVVSSKRKDQLVLGVAIVSALVYLYYPMFLPRLLMYMSIWWLGVMLSNKHINQEPISFPSLAMPLSGVFMVFLICGFGVYRASLEGVLPGPGVHPLLEMRDHFSALVIVLIAVFWRATGWVLFDKTVRPFLFFAPISYVVYISHYYFLVGANYFVFMNNKALEFAAAMLALMAFAYVVELIIYPRMLKIFSAALMAPAQVKYPA